MLGLEQCEDQVGNIQVKIMRILLRPLVELSWVQEKTMRMKENQKICD